MKRPIAWTVARWTIVIGFLAVGGWLAVLIGRF